MHTNHCKAYCLEVFQAVQNAFQRRGFVWEAIPNSPAQNEPSTIRCQACILLQGRRVGVFDLQYTRRGRGKRLDNGTVVNTYHPVRNSLWLEVSYFESGAKDVVAQKNHNFRLRGLDANGNCLGGRPKVKKWAAHAAKALAVHNVNRQAEYIHDQ